MKASKKEPQGLTIKKEIEEKTVPKSNVEIIKTENILEPHKFIGPNGQSYTQPAMILKEDEPELNESDVVLNDSDLNLVVDNFSFLKAFPLSEGDLAHLWGGARGSYGYNEGKICYQVKWLENCDISHIIDKERQNCIKVGWSSIETSLQLGDESYSYCYGSMGLICENLKYISYGQPFTVGDIITVYLEFTDSQFIISFSKNNIYLGQAYKISTKNQKITLFPHVLSKNVKFEVNFGQEPPWTHVLNGFRFVSTIGKEKSVQGPRRPDTRADCEMIMMCGLPSAGKTNWVNHIIKNSKNRRYNVLGTNIIMNQFNKIEGLAKNNDANDLIKRCETCVQKLLAIGCHRRRNYILDQTNVFADEQNQAMQNFGSFIRKAVVVIPSDEEYQIRLKKRTKDSIIVPESTVLEMKANFSIPKQKFFDNIMYAELKELEAKQLLAKYAQEKQTRNEEMPEVKSQGSQLVTTGRTVSYTGRDFDRPHWRYNLNRGGNRFGNSRGTAPSHRFNYPLQNRNFYYPNIWQPYYFQPSQINNFRTNPWQNGYPGFH